VSSIQSLSSIFGPPLMTGSFAYFSAPGAPVYFPGAPFVLAAGFSVLTLAMFWRAVAMGAGDVPRTAVAQAQ
jgi:DHA1 family tetracycline resistance protein-like MFS transporter